MSDSPPRLPALWLVTALALAVAAACADAGGGDAASGAHGLGVYVAASWRQARQANGHRIHVVGKQVECTKCHDLTSDSIGSVNVRRCAACHEKQARLEHAAEQAQARFGAGVKADCTSCHAFTLESTGHAARVAGNDEPFRGHAPGDCKRCHAEQQGALPAVVVHASNECLRCHRPHEQDKPQSAPCPVCHGDVTTRHAAAGKTPSATCSTCHEHQHAPAAEARSGCLACHAQQKPAVPATAVFPDGHNECVGCHRPHQFEREKAVACRTCHEGVHVLGQRVPQHADCTSCHSPHDVRGSPERACAGCHRDVHPDHPRRGSAGTCVGCHDPHPASQRADTRVRNCSSCHQIAASEKDFHGGVACQRCHKPHDFVLALVEKPACESCHAKQIELVSAVSGHLACKGCHAGLPHRPAALEVGCDTCHTRQHADVNQGHRECTKCHEPHGGSFSAGCKTCHAAEHQSAPAAHRDCQGCHQPHSGNVKVACSSCHADESKTPHGLRGGACTACHRPHGPEGVAKPPECASCHQPDELSGLHGEPQHRPCLRCHTGHGEAAPDSQRDACLGCHVERKNHFPDAPRCASCHLFGKTR